MRGAGFSLWRPGRPRLIGQPSSRTGENPPYGMSGGIEETSASFEARSAPRSYPTAAAEAGLPRGVILMDEPTKYWLSTLPEDIGFARLVELAKLRWRIERDYQELKQELGLGHYEGRGWRGFHHHASLCMAAYGFLVAERVRIPPSGWAA